jgi:tellurite methyltransferase
VVLLNNRRLTDPLFIARLGHQVVAIDISSSGTLDLKAGAVSQGLCIDTEIVDIRSFHSAGRFDVIVLDRTLHMIEEGGRTSVLGSLLGLTKTGSHVLIADERSNISAFKSVFERSPWKWSVTLERGGFFFAVRT